MVNISQSSSGYGSPNYSSPRYSSNLLSSAPRPYNPVTAKQYPRPVSVADIPISGSYSEPSPSSESPTPSPYRQLPIVCGVIPNIGPYHDSSIRVPETNREEFLKEKAREQWAITKQTYRTLPLIEPRPKVRRDLPTGSFLKYMDGPTWHDPPRVMSPAKHLDKVINKQYGKEVRFADNSPVVHKQYNSPINVYSSENVIDTLTPTSGSPRPTYGAPQPLKSSLQKPLSVDITQSPTYQLLQEEEESVKRPVSKERAIEKSSNYSGPGYSPKFSPRPKCAPNYPIQTPYFRSLMNSLLPTPGV